MEINATNEARSTENENATHDTWFRLSLDLYTPRDKGGSNPDSNLSFSGTTPEAFDHALATILDVVTSTVYGGQLNGLQEIIDRSTAELRADSEKAQHGAARRRHVGGHPAPGASRGRRPAAQAQAQAQAQPRPGRGHPEDQHGDRASPQLRPPSKPGARGAKGLMLLTCPGCHHTFKHFARENTDKVKCFCGTEVPVDNVARFEFTCKQCGKLSYGWTNIEAATIEAGALHCVCTATAPEMIWHPATRKFHG